MFPNLCLITRPLMDELKELMLHATCGKYPAIHIVYHLKYDLRSPNYHAVRGSIKRR